MLALKGNQPRLHNAVEGAFAAAALPKDHWCREHGHGRTDLRVLTAMEVDPEDPIFSEFKGIQQIFQIRRERVHNRTGHVDHEITYAITNAPRHQMSPALAAQAIRYHWRIENLLHRVKDVRMKEDQDQTHTRHAPHNLGILRNLALTIINQASAANSPAKRFQVVETQPWRAYKIMGLAG